MNSEVEDVLLHYGKKGMKWGVTTKSSSTSKSAKEQPASSDAVRVSAIKQKVTASAFKSTPTRTAPLSNAELQTAVARMNLEQQYARLESASRPPAIKFVAGLVGSVGKQKASNVVNNAANKQVADALKNKK